jgi:hypothetical protein
VLTAGNHTRDRDFSILTTAAHPATESVRVRLTHKHLHCSGLSGPHFWSERMGRSLAEAHEASNTIDIKHVYCMIGVHGALRNASNESAIASAKPS